MEVNDELAVLRRAMPASIDAINVGGRVVVESYHSLEDRLVKQAFVAATRSRRPGGHAVRAGGARARAAPGHPGQREGQPGGDLREPARRLGAAARDRASARQGSSMSSPAPGNRHEHSGHADPVPDPALRRGRRGAGPPDGRPAPAYGGRPRAVPGPGLDGAARRRRRAAALQHLDAAGVVRDHRTGAAVHPPRRPRAEPVDGPRSAAQPPADRGRRAEARDGPGVQPGVPPARHRQGHRRTVRRLGPPADQREGAHQAGDPEPEAEDHARPGTGCRRRGRQRRRQLVRRHGRWQRRAGPRDGKKKNR